MDEATHHLETPIADDAQAKGVEQLLALARDLEKRAEESRMAENKPFDDGRAEVQERYKPISTAVTILAAQCRNALVRWRNLLEERQRAAAAEIRRAAEEKSAQAQHVAEVAGSDVRTQAIVAQTEEDARRLLKNADRAERKVGKGLRMRTVRIAEIPTDEDLKLAIAWVYREYRDEMRAFIEERVQAKVSKNSALVDIPGVVITETKEAF